MYVKILRFLPRKVTSNWLVQVIKPHDLELQAPTISNRVN